MKPLFGIAGGASLIGITAIIALWIHPRGDARGYAMTALIGTAGIAIGWLIGFLASPYSSVEERRFSRYAATVSAFLGGYGLSKMEPSVSLVFADGNLVTKPLYGARLLIFLICIIAAAITMYVFRLYTLGEQLGGRRDERAAGS